jgi:hypothetical protein
MKNGNLQTLFDKTFRVDDKPQRRTKMCKKLSIIVLSILVVSVLISCSKDKDKVDPSKAQTTAVVPPENKNIAEKIVTQVMELGKSYQINENAKIEIIKIKTKPFIESLLGDTATAFSREQGKSKLDFLVSLTNTSIREQTAAELIPVMALLGDSTYLATYEIEVENYTQLSADKKIAPRETVWVHCVMAIPIDATVVQISVGEKKEFMIEVNPKNTVVQKQKPMVIGRPVKVTGQAKIILNDVAYHDTLEPDNPKTTNGYISYIEASRPENTLLVLDVTVTNLTKKKKDIRELFKVRPEFKGMEFNSFSIIIKEEGQFDIPNGEMTSRDIKAGQTQTVYCVMEVPETLKQAEAALSIAMPGQERSYLISPAR